MGPFLGRRKHTHDDVLTLHNKLVVWYDSVPQTLKYDDDDPTVPLQSPIIQMQALALQLAYDNLHIVLHKQAVFPREHIERRTDGHNSAKQLLDSALRTSRVIQCKVIDQVCRSSHAAMHAAICSFSAAVILCALHRTSLEPGERGMALEGINQIVNFLQDFPTTSYPLTSQALRILIRLRRKCLEDLDEARSSPQVTDDEVATGMSLTI